MMKKLYMALSGLPLIMALLLIRWLDSYKTRGDDWSAMIPGILLVGTCLVSLTFGVIGIWLTIRALRRNERILGLVLATILAGSVGPVVGFLIFPVTITEAVGSPILLFPLTLPVAIYVMITNKPKQAFVPLLRWLIRISLLLGPVVLCVGFIGAYDGTWLSQIFVVFIVVASAFYFRAWQKFETST